MASAGTVAEALKRIAAESPDIVPLDLGLPKGNGKDVIRQARQWSAVPIIVLSAREREAEKMEALDLGADDYVNKPFNVGELMARMRAVLRHRMRRNSRRRTTSLRSRDRWRKARISSSVALSPAGTRPIAMASRTGAPIDARSAKPRTSHEGWIVSSSVARFRRE
jgi:DNA-binding response OmpR family regulator